MFQDAGQIASDRRLRTDVCIVGAGAAGITIAKQLIGSGLNVLLLESGGFETEEGTQDLYNGSNVGHPYFPLDTARSRFFGGSTNCWGGMCRPLDEIDFEVRDWVPHSGWPFNLAHLKPFYQRAQEVLNLGPFDYEAKSWARPEAPALALEGSPMKNGVFQLSPPTRMGQQYRDELDRARKIRVLLHANVVNINLNRAGNRVDSLSVRTLKRGPFRVTARRYVLATGGIENARLLLSSDNVQPNGVGNQHDLVGRYFMEHPHTDFEGLFLASRTVPSIDFYRPHGVDGQGVWGYLKARSDVLRQHRILNFAIVPMPVRVQQDTSDLIKHLQRASAEVDSFLDLSLSASKEVSILTLGTPSEQAPNPESRVRLSGERDALGMRRVELDWRLSDIDKRTLVTAHKILAQAVGFSRLGRLQLTLSEDEPAWPNQMKGGNHHMGTTRMHDDPKQGVVDARGSVHGVSNLLVAGSSVYPTCGVANPTLTLVALALRTAQHLREQLA